MSTKWRKPECPEPNGPTPTGVMYYLRLAAECRAAGDKDMAYGELCEAHWQLQDLQGAGFQLPLTHRLGEGRPSPSHQEEDKHMTEYSKGTSTTDEYRKGTFKTDGIEGCVFKGYHVTDTHVWWPLFTVEQVKAIMEAHTAIWLEAAGDASLAHLAHGYDAATDEFWYHGNGNDWQYPEEHLSRDKGREIIVDGKPLRVYAIGIDGDWTWRDAEEQDEQTPAPLHAHDAIDPEWFKTAIVYLAPVEQIMEQLPSNGQPDYQKSMENLHHQIRELAAEAGIKVTEIQHGPEFPIHGDSTGGGLLIDVIVHGTVEMGHWCYFD